MVYDYLIELELGHHNSWNAHITISEEYRGCFLRNVHQDCSTKYIRYVLHLPKPLAIPVLADILGVSRSCISLCRDVHTAINFLNFN